MLNMLGVDVCAYGFGGLGTGICALMTQIMYGALQLVCKLLGTFVDLLNIAFYIFAGVDYGGDGRFNIVDMTTQESMNILDYFIFNENVTKAYLYLALIALVLVAIFTIYKIIKQDYFDKAGPRSKGPILRNVAISCISFILVIPIFYLIIHASSLLSVQVFNAMGMDMDTYAGMKIFELSWSDGFLEEKMALHKVNNALAGSANGRVGSIWFIEDNLLFILLADGELVKYDQEAIDAVRALHDSSTWEGPLATLHVEEGGMLKFVFYTNFYWYIFFVGAVVALKSLWNLTLAMIQRIFKLLGLFLVAPAPISQYVLDDGAKYKEWLKKSIEEGLRLVVATMAFSIFLLVVGLVSHIDFSTAFQKSMEAAKNATAELEMNVSASTLEYAGEFSYIPTLDMLDLGANIGLADDMPTPDLIEKFEKANKCNAILVNGELQCGYTFFEMLINAFLQCLLIVAAGGAIKDLDTVLSPLISGAQSSLDSGNTGGAVNAVGKAAMAVAGAAIGGVASGAIAAVKNKDAGKAGAEAGAKEEEKDAQGAEKSDDAGANAPTAGGGASAPTEGGNNSEKDGETDGANAPEGGADVEENPTAEENNNGEGNDDDKGADPVEATENKDPNATEGEEKSADDKAESKSAGAEVDKEKITRGDVGKAALGDIDSLKKVGKGIKAGVGGAIDKAKGAIGGAVDKFNNTKVGKFFGKNLIGRVLAAPGKLALRAASNVVKNGPRAILGGLKRGTLAGLKSAGGALATAVVGETAVKSFLNAKKESDAAEKNSANKKFDKARNKAFTANRAERIEKAQEEAQKATRGYESSVTGLKSAANQETQAAQNLDEAEKATMAAEAAAASANSEILAQDKPLLEAQAQARENDALVEEAQRDNKNILKTAGVDNFEELESKIALLEKGSPERTQLEALRKKYVPEKTINEWQAKADQGRETAASRARILDTLTGRDGRLTRAGIQPGTKFADAKATVAEKAKAAQAVIDELGGMDHSKLSATDKKRLAEATEIAQLNDDLSKCDSAEKTYFERKTVQNARTQNDALTRARSNRDEARAAYDSAHKARESAQTSVNNMATQFSKSNGLAHRLMGTEGYANNMGQTSFTTKDGGRNDKVNAKRAKVEKRLKAGMHGGLNADSGLLVKDKNGQVIFGEDASLVTDYSEVTKKIATPTGRKELYGLCDSYTQQVYGKAANTFANATVGTSKMSEILETHGVTATDGHYNVKAIKKLIADKKFGDNTDAVSQHLSVYEAAGKTYDAQQRTLTRVNVTQQNAGTIAQRIVNNANRSTALANESAIMQQVIASGGEIKLTPQMTQILNSVPGAHITSQSSKAEILETARTARHQRIVDQEAIRRENAGLNSQNTQLQESMKSMISGLANELRGNNTNKPNANQVTNNQTQNTTINNFANGGTQTQNTTSSFDFASAIKSPDQMSESMYERTQTELAKANKEMLERVREQNKEILNTVENIEREVKED